MKRLGILLSGRGSNFEAIARKIQAGELNADIATVIANKDDAPGLAIAKSRGLRALCIASLGKDRDEHDAAVIDELQSEGVDLVCLAGYMRLLSSKFIKVFRERILNIHPSLLPSFPGLHGAEQALNYGVKVAGCTVHFVDEGLDSGPIIAQASVPVLEDDTAETLASRILKEEHRIYPSAISLVLSGRFVIEGRRVKAL